MNYQLTAAGQRRPVQGYSAALLLDGCPLILHDACRAWPARGKWSLDWLRRNFGQRVVDVGAGPISLAAFLDHVATAHADQPSPYLREHFLAEHFPELLADIEPLLADDRNRLNSRWLPGIRQYRRGAPDLLIAGPGSRFPVLHYDLHHLHAFITQICGEKLFFLYPPDQGRLLYPEPDRPNVSRITGFDPVDHATYPRHADAICHQVLLQEGETIFIPSGWWHRTEVLATSIAITWNLVNAANWQDFVNDCYFGRDGSRPFRAQLRRLYLAGVNGLLNIQEAGRL